MARLNVILKDGTITKEDLVGDSLEKRLLALKVDLNKPDKVLHAWMSNEDA